MPTKIIELEDGTKMIPVEALPKGRDKAPVKVTVKYTGKPRWVARGDRFLEPGDKFETNEHDAKALAARYQKPGAKKGTSVPAFEISKAKKEAK